MTADQRTRIVDTVAHVVPKVLDTITTGPNYCVLATRVGIEVLRAYNVRCQPLAVKLDALPPVYVERMKQGRRPDAPGEDVDEWKEAGAYGVTLGRTEEIDGPDAEYVGWDGHVGILVFGPTAMSPNTGRLFVDLTLKQVQRPERNLIVEAIGFEVPRGWEHTTERHAWTLRNGTMVQYEADPENRRYLTAPDWANVSKVRMVGANVAAMVAAQIGGKP